MNRFVISKVVYIILGIWLVISLAAITGLYRLWWQRERIFYAGKSIEEQRKQVFQRAGLPSSALTSVEAISKQWPERISYKARGNQNLLSYVTYLLIPRIPSGDSRYFLHAKGNRIVWSGENRHMKPLDEKKTNNMPEPVGFFISLFLVSGIAVLLRKNRFSQLSWPEAMGLAVAGLMAVALIFRGLFHSVNIGFFILSVLGIVGWVFTFYHLFFSKKKTRQDAHQQSIVSPKQPFVNHDFRTKSFFTVLASLILLNIVWSALMAVVVVPDDWDAWAIWGAKAKVLALGSGPLLDVTWFGHGDYPLLWPVVWAFSGWCGGGWEEQWSRGWGTVFLFLCIWEMYLIVRQKTGKHMAGLLVSTLFVSIPMVPLLTSWSYAEAPLWLMMLCALACFFRWQENNRHFEVAVAGLFCAAAAYTKNEGVLFTLMLMCCFAISPGHRIKAVAVFSAIFIASYAPWAYWVRCVHDLRSHTTVGLVVSKETLSYAMGRLPEAMDAIQRMWSDVRQWNIVGWITGIGWLYLLVSPRTRTRYILFLPPVMLLAYLIIILFHKDEIYWQIGTSWNRLTVQVFPLFLVTIVPEIWRQFFSFSND